VIVIPPHLDLVGTPIHIGAGIILFGVVGIVGTFIHIE
jgi:hypothetical protein